MSHEDSENVPAPRVADAYRQHTRGEHGTMFSKCTAEPCAILRAADRLRFVDELSSPKLGAGNVVKAWNTHIKDRHAPAFPDCLGYPCRSFGHIERRDYWDTVGPPAQSAPAVEFIEPVTAQTWADAAPGDIIAGKDGSRWRVSEMTEAPSATPLRVPDRVIVGMWKIDEFGDLVGDEVRGKVKKTTGITIANRGATGRALDAIREAGIEIEIIDTWEG